MTERSLTVALLIYKSPRWLKWVLRNLALATNETSFNTLIVANDASGSVIDALRPMGSFSDWFRWVDHRSEDPHEYQMARVYRAWNRCIAECKTDDIILINSDMAFSGGWIDELYAVRDAQPNAIPTSLLVESGRLVSGLPDYVRDFGRDPDQFDRAGFEVYAAELKARGPARGTSFSGGLFMPVLWRKRDLERLGGYPTQEPNHVLASDAVLFNAARDLLGLEHRTACRSIVYHAQLGETEEP